MNSINKAFEKFEKFEKKVKKICIDVNDEAIQGDYDEDVSQVTDEVENRILQAVQELKSSILQNEQELENRIQELSKRGVKCCDDNLEIANELEISQEENQKLKKEIERLKSTLKEIEEGSLIPEIYIDDFNELSRLKEQRKKIEDRIKQLENELKSDEYYDTEKQELRHIIINLKSLIEDDK